MALFINKFYPNFISGCQLWLDASDSSTLFQDSAATTPATADGDPIGCWKDKSGKGKNATQSDGTLKAALASNYKNQRNAIYFDGTKILDISSFPTLTQTSIFVVMRVQYIGNFDRFITWKLSLDIDELTPPAFIPVLRYGTNDQLISYTDSAKAPISVSPNSWIILSQTNSGTTVRNIKNNDAAASSSITQFNRGSLVHLCAIRGTNGAPNTFAKAHICELIWYDSVLSDINLTNMKLYLNNKWSIY